MQKKLKRLLIFQYIFKNLLISLIEQIRSPMGTRSMILSSRPNDEDSHDGFTKWPFMSTHPWAEYPRGKWSLEVKNLKYGKKLIDNQFKSHSNLNLHY